VSKKSSFLTKIKIELTLSKKMTNPRKGEEDEKKKRIEDSMNEICYDIVRKHVLEDSQVMVFVHSRKETIKYAQYLVDKFRNDGESYAF